MIRRKCWYDKSAATYPVHVPGNALDGLPAGTRPFRGLTGDMARSELRRMLRRFEVPNADAHGTHDLNREHHQDLVQGGKTLFELLVASGWHAPGAHKSFSDLVDQLGAVVEAHAASLAEDDDK